MSWLVGGVEMFDKVIGNKYFTVSPWAVDEATYEGKIFYELPDKCSGKYTMMRVNDGKFKAFYEEFIFNTKNDAIFFLTIAKENGLSYSDLVEKARQNHFPCDCLAGETHVW